MTKEKIIIDTLAALRKRDKLSFKELSNRSGITASGLSQKERNLFHYTLQEVLILSNIFNLDLLIDNKRMLDSKEFADLVKKIREKKELSQDVIRLYAGMSTVSIYGNKEKNRVQFKLNEVIKICEYLNLSIKLVYEQDGNVKEIIL